MLEVCVDSMESVLNAIYGGADELELCSSLSHGGLTPSPGFVHSAIKALEAFVEGTDRKKPKLNVMIRCRPGADFDFTELEMETMLEDIRFYKLMDIDRFVFGCLDDMGRIEQTYNNMVVQTAKPKPVTFHRAFDLCTSEDPLSEIRKLGFDRLLTSGRGHSADEVNSVLTIKRLLDQTNKTNDVVIMPGGGVHYGNALIFLELGCRMLHSSCKKPYTKDQRDPSLGMAVHTFYVTDQKNVEDLKGVIDEFIQNLEFEREKEELENGI